MVQTLNETTIYHMEILTQHEMAPNTSSSSSSSLISFLHKHWYIENEVSINMKQNKLTT